MNVEFTELARQIIAEQGREILFDPAKAKSFLSDYARGEWARERRLLLQAVEAGAAKALDEAEDLSACKKRQERILREDYFVDAAIAADVIDLLVLVLRGQAAGIPGGRAGEIKSHGQNGGAGEVQAKTEPPFKNNYPLLPERYLKIEDGVLKDCPLKEGRKFSVRVPDTVTEIGERAFSGCGGLLEIYIPDSVTKIGDYAFEGCVNLEEVYITDNVWEIGKNVFHFTSGFFVLWISNKLSYITKRRLSGLGYGYGLNLIWN
jgi:hypothetical protein